MPFGFQDIYFLKGISPFKKRRILMYFGVILTRPANYLRQKAGYNQTMGHFTTRHSRIFHRDGTAESLPLIAIDVGG